MYQDLSFDHIPHHPGLSLIHIDCDLYNSTVDALNLCKKILNKGSIILLDDYFSGLSVNVIGEKKALEEFCFNKNISLITWFQYGHNGQAFFLN